MTTPPNDPGGYGGGAGYGGAPSYGTPAGGSRTNVMAIIAIIAGVLAIIASCLWFVAGPLGIAAIVLGVLGRGKAKRGEAGGGGLAMAGIITGAIGLVLTIVLTLIGVSFLNQFENCTDPSLTAEEQQACVEEQVGG
ncbi:hypothetical protein GCM10028777_25930 [Angustibacter speluncae]